MGYDALTLGEADLSAPDLLAKASSLSYPLVSANVHYPAGQGPNIVPYVIKEVGGVKVAITGVLDAEIARSAPQLQGPDAPVVDDEVAALNVLVPELRYEASIVVVLAHTGMIKARTLAAQVPGIDIIIAGHGGGMAAVPTKIGRAYLVQAGEAGENMGEIVFSVSPDWSTTNVTGKATPLTKDIPEDPAVKAMVDAFLERTSPTPSSAAIQR